MEQTPEYLSIFLEYVPGGSIGRIIRTHGKVGHLFALAKVR